MAGRVKFCTPPQEAGGIKFITPNIGAFCSSGRLITHPPGEAAAGAGVANSGGGLLGNLYAPALRSAVQEALLEEVQRFLHGDHCIQLQNSDNPVNVSDLVNYLHR